MTEPLVSVILPTFNRFDLIGETINSILNQSYKTLELIIVDDGSTDNTKNIVNKFTDERIKYFCIYHSGKPAVPRNVGIKNATGKYLAFCDDDDLWHSEKLMIQVKTLENNSCGLCFTNIILINNDGDICKKQTRIKKIYQNLTFNKFILSGGCIFNSSVMIRHEAVNSVGMFNEDPKIIAGEDFNYWSRVLHQYSCCYVEQKLTFYRINRLSIQPKKATDILLKELYVFNSIKKTISIKKKIIILKYFTLFIRHIINFFYILLLRRKINI